MSFQQKKQPFKLHLAVFGCVFIHVHPAQTWQTVQNENQRKQGSMSLPWGSQEGPIKTQHNLSLHIFTNLWYVIVLK
jgi:hypothetical protein